MVGTIAWIALFVAIVQIMFFSHTQESRTATITKTGDAVATRVSGRVILLLFWIFVGVHLFTRYTLPGH
jgi:multidrug resistance efflux pump